MLALPMEKIRVVLNVGYTSNALLRKAKNMNDIWDTRDVSIFYRENDNWWYASACWVSSIDYLNKSGICSYCGHEVKPGEACPGCAARKTHQSLAVGEAKVILCGYLPVAAWMFHPQNEVCLNIRHCGPPEIFANYVGRFMLTNCKIINRSVEGFSGPNEWDALSIRMEFTCDITFTEWENK